jgi:zinc/manganese transport system substrate-binding protein
MRRTDDSFELVSSIGCKPTPVCLKNPLRALDGVFALTRAAGVPSVDQASVYNRCRVTRFFLLALILALSACQSPREAANLQSPGRLRVIATFSILGDFAQNVGGDRIELKTLVGLGSDVHEFEPNPSDALGMRNADVVIENGIGLESWLDRLYTSSGSQARRVLASQGIPTQTRVTDGKAETDPHVWQDVGNAISMTKTIRDALVAADPPNASAYQDNAAAYIAQLQALDKDIMAEVGRLPVHSRKLVTSHDAIGYFAARYGFQVIGSLLGTVSTASGDPSAKVFAQLVQDVKAAGVKAVFVESVANPANMERLAKEANVVIGPKLYTDSLGPAGSEGSTYITAMRHNARALVNALIGQ